MRKFSCIEIKINFIISYFLLFNLLTTFAQTKIAFGSCGHQDKPQPILDVVLKHHPDYFVYLGDNIYSDTYDPSVLEKNYNALKAQPEFERLKIGVKNILATWDDHDYGNNDDGRHYPLKEVSKKIFLNFWEVPKSDERWGRSGIYTSKYFKEFDKTIQFILLDTRSFRDNLRIYRGEKNSENRYFYPLDYFPHNQPDSTLLGKDQWVWLENQLVQPEDVRIICSSTQFAIEYNGYEAWANFPFEQQKMIDLIAKTKANGVIFISGDVHYGEISVLKPSNTYPIYDITSSGITSTWHFATPNRNRIEGPIMDNHFGLLSIDWNQKDPTIKMEIIDVSDNQRVEYTIPISTLKYK